MKRGQKSQKPQKGAIGPILPFDLRDQVLGASSSCRLCLRISKRCFLHAIFAAGCCLVTCCTGLRLTDDAPALQTIGKPTLGVGTTLTELASRRMNELTIHAVNHDALIVQANRLFSRLDGQRRGSSRAAILSQMGIAAGGIATAALNAAAPAANAAWIQGLNATSTGAASVRSEFATQRMTGEAYAQTLTILANDIMAAKQQVNFPEALSLVESGDERAWTAAMRRLGEGIRALETAIVLRPLTLTVNVVRDSTTSASAARKK